MQKITSASMLILMFDLKLILHLFFMFTLLLMFILRCCKNIKKKQLKINKIIN